MRALIALGSNLGDRRTNLEHALSRLEESGIELIERSEILETEPVGGDPEKPYLNMVAVVETPPDPWGLLDLLKRIEAEMGRDADAPRMAPRVIDIDIIDCRGVTVSSAPLTIPHPRLWRREFVLRPLQTLPGRGDRAMARPLRHEEENGGRAAEAGPAGLA